jgi:Fe2+ or Zn2+ uptake regulation protein
MLALSDRILLKLSAKAWTARQLASALEAQIASVNRVLRALEEQGLVEAFHVPNDAAGWRTAADVHVDFRPSHLVITRGVTATSRSAEEPLERCRAFTVAGRPCKRDAVFLHLCLQHGAFDTGLAEA